MNKDIIDSLEMSEYIEVPASPDRPNIYYEVKPRTSIEVDFLSASFYFEGKDH